LGGDEGVGAELTFGDDVLKFQNKAFPDVKAGQPVIFGGLSPRNKGPGMYKFSLSRGDDGEPVREDEVFDLVLVVYYEATWKQ
jgi:hypothetical protein